MASYNNFSTALQLTEYLENIGGVTYLSEYQPWSEAMKNVAGGASKLVNSAKGVGTEITSIADAYLSVGKEIAVDATSGLKSAPTVETIITEAEGGAVAGSLAIGTEAVGVGATASLATVLGAIFAGLGMGVYSYETSPEFWVNASNFIFGTDINVDSVQPLIRSKIRTLLSAKNAKPISYVPSEYISKAYEFIANHTTRYEAKEGFNNITFDPVTGLATSANRLNRPVTYELNYVSLKLMESFMQDITNRAIELGYDVQPLDLTELYKRMQNEWDLSGEYYVRMTFRPIMKVWENNFDTSYVGRYTVFGIEVFEKTIFDNIPKVNVNAKSNDTNYRCFGLKDGQVLPQLTAFTTPKYSASLAIYTRPTGPETTYSLVENGHANHISGPEWGERGIDQYIYIGDSFYEGLAPLTDYSTLPKADLDLLTTFFFTSNFQPDIRPEMDFDELLDGAVFVTGLAPDPAKTPDELYYEWLHEHGLEIAQPNRQGENAITTYVPLQVPAEMTDPARIIEHGVNVETDPLSPNLPQPRTQEGTIPDNISPEAIDEAIRPSIDDYNDSRTTPDSAPDPLPDSADNPQYPNEPTQNPSGDSGFIPDAPDIVGGTATGLISLYNPTKAELSTFAGWLWSDNFLDNFIKIFSNPMDAIIGLHILYATPATGSSTNIQVGYLTSPATAKIVTRQYTEIDCGTVSIPEYYGNATDYEPYTQIHCYLPFIGIVPLKTDDVMGKTLNIKYGVDALTGTCLASLTTYKNGSKITVYTFSGNCAVQLPISAGNYGSMIMGLAGAVASGIGAIVTKNPIMALGAGASLMSGNVSVQHSGAIGSNAGAMGIRKPYLIVTRKTAYDASNYNEFYGFPANKTVVLNACRGYTKVKDVHVDGIGIATDTEKQQIETLLKSGVIIN